MYLTNARSLRDYRLWQTECRRMHRLDGTGGRDNAEYYGVCASTSTVTDWLP